MSPEIRLSLEIGIPGYLRDHRYLGRCVLPAAESLQLLAASVQRRYPDRNVRVMTDVSFPRFLFIGEEDAHIRGRAEIRTDGEGDLVASLTTLVPLPERRITRAREHARARFPGRSPEIEPLSFLGASRIPDAGFEVSPARLYSELVPLGPAFHNVISSLRLTGEGAAAHVRATCREPLSGPLGSPFVLDAALHCACAWGQRFAGIVAFPVGFAKRFVFRPVAAGAICFARTVPVGTGREGLVFDVWIYGADGVLDEAALGVVMRDVSGGRLKPPPWIRA